MDGTIDNIWGYGQAQLPFLAPKEPLNVSLNIVGNAVTVLWDPPTFDGGSEVSGYLVSVNPGGISQLVGADTLSYEVNNLVYDQQYEFVVAAVNSEGEGESSQAVSTMITNSAPIIVDSSISGLTSVESQEFTVALTYFNDIDSVDSHTASIDWGDGNVSAGVIATDGSQKSVSGTHLYIDDGGFSISVEIEDSHGNSSSVIIPFTSLNSDPVVSSIDSYSWYGTMVMLDMPSFVDLGLNDTH